MPYSEKKVFLHKGRGFFGSLNLGERRGVDLFFSGNTFKESSENNLLCF